jgi:hypothetical protein
MMTVVWDFTNHRSERLSRSKAGTIYQDSLRRSHAWETGCHSVWNCSKGATVSEQTWKSTDRDRRSGSLAQEIRIENSLTDTSGQEAQLKTGAKVEVSIKAAPESIGL